MRAYALEADRRLVVGMLLVGRIVATVRIVFLPVLRTTRKADAVVVLSRSKHERPDRVSRSGGRKSPRRSSSPAASTHASRRQTACAGRVATASPLRASRRTPTPRKARREPRLRSPAGTAAARAARDVPLSRVTRARTLFDRCLDADGTPSAPTILTSVPGGRRRRRAEARSVFTIARAVSTTPSERPTRKRTGLSAAS